MTDTEPLGPCAHHPGEEAVATCGRCGDFVCPACAPTSDGGVCAACRARSGAVETRTIAWEAEDVGVAAGFGRTLWELVRQPRAVLGARGSLGSAAAYLVAWIVALAAASVLSQLIFLVALDPSTAASRVRDAGVLHSLALTLITLFGRHAVAVPLMVATGYWLGLRAAGGRVAYRDGLWTVAYLYAVCVAAAVLIPLLGIPESVAIATGVLVLGPIDPTLVLRGAGTVLWAAAWIHLAYRLSQVAVDRDGARPGRGWIAGVLALVLAATCCSCGVAVWQLVSDPAS